MPNERWEQLAQLRPADTIAATLYTGVLDWQYQLKVIVVNVDVSGQTYRLFHDEDGSTYDASTALAWDRSVASGGIDEVPETGAIYMDGDNSGTIGVRSGTGNALTFTLYGTRQRKSRD